MNDIKIRHSLQLSRIYGKHAEKIRKIKAIVQDVHTDDDEFDGEKLAMVSNFCKSRL